MQGLSQIADNNTEVRWQYDPDTMMTVVMLEGPTMWEGDSADQVVMARFTPDQMRAVTMWWTSNDPGDRWTSSPPST